MGLYTDIDFYNINYLRDNFSQWTLSGGAYIQNAVAYLPSGASMSTELSNEYMSGSLEKSKYKKILISSMRLHDIIGPESIFSCGELGDDAIGVEVFIDTTYVSSDRLKREKVKISLNNFKYNQFIGTFAGWGKYEYIYECVNWNIESCKVTIKNNTSSEIIINAALLYRSQDVSQVGQNILTTQMHITEFRPCYDGIQINVQELAGHNNYWWLDDGDGNFVGINYNNEYLAANNPYDGLLDELNN